MQELRCYYQFTLFLHTGFTWILRIHMKECCIRIDAVICRESCPFITPLSISGNKSISLSTYYVHLTHVNFKTNLLRLTFRLIWALSRRKTYSTYVWESTTNSDSRSCDECPLTFCSIVYNEMVNPLAARIIVTTFMRSCVH